MRGEFRVRWLAPEADPANLADPWSVAEGLASQSPVTAERFAAFLRIRRRFYSRISDAAGYRSKHRRGSIFWGYWYRCYDRHRSCGGEIRAVNRRGARRHSIPPGLRRVSGPDRGSFAVSSLNPVISCARIAALERGTRFELATFSLGS